jgi:hypothetical protein
MYRGEMKYVIAGLIATLVFLATYFLLASAVVPILDQMGWGDHELSWNMRLRTCFGLVVAACSFRLVIEWRNNAALKWRKTLAARARA